MSAPFSTCALDTPRPSAETIHRVPYARICLIVSPWIHQSSTPPIHAITHHRPRHRPVVPIHKSAVHPSTRLSIYHLRPTAIHLSYILRSFAFEFDLVRILWPLPCLALVVYGMSTFVSGMGLKHTGPVFFLLHATLPLPNTASPLQCTLYSTSFVRTTSKLDPSSQGSVKTGVSSNPIDRIHP
ncbi:hypothetical protein BDN70DRAFT_396170 [Pholiota conissans]|uniref:Uncharacterized protein n=1 Tax=Pholiota conissans TaxID=109636 RepID=A0A9P6CTU6_9AGAR|nr:hypothetical protein BDN70DRAFT_396170 [Pholiota conissans]